MNTKTTTNKLIGLFIIALVLAPLALFAQGGPLDTADTPVDGGISLMLIAGIGYGAKKLREKRVRK